MSGKWGKEGGRRSIMGGVWGRMSVGGWVEIERKD